MSQPEDEEERIRRGDQEWVSIDPLKVTITYNEKHAVLLGIGTALAVTQRPEYFIWPVAFAFLGWPLIKAVTDVKPSKTVAARTVKHEPWWFLIPYTVLFLIVTGV